MPVLNPSGVQEFLDFGLHGWAMSRYSGCWVAMRAIADTVETSAAVQIDPFRIETKLPEDFTVPPGGLGIRWPDQPLAQELRLQRYKVYAAMAYARANGLNRVVIDSPRRSSALLRPASPILTSGRRWMRWASTRHWPRRSGCAFSKSA
jgi:indolepyruvate ferredoxin oxidoreductase